MKAPVQEKHTGNQSNTDTHQEEASLEQCPNMSFRLKPSVSWWDDQGKHTTKIDSLCNLTVSKCKSTCNTPKH